MSRAARAPGDPVIVGIILSMPDPGGLSTATFPGVLEWELVDEFLSAHLPEGPRIGYRANGSLLERQPGSPTRFVDTVAATANGGGEGGSHLLRCQHRRAACPCRVADAEGQSDAAGKAAGLRTTGPRHRLPSAVPIEVGVARGAAGEVVVVRVPVVETNQPVYVNDLATPPSPRAVLVRRGGHNVSMRKASLADYYEREGARSEKGTGVPHGVAARGRPIRRTRAFPRVGNADEDADCATFLARGRLVDCLQKTGVPSVKTRTSGIVPVAPTADKKVRSAKDGRDSEFIIPLGKVETLTTGGGRDWEDGGAASRRG
jgi:hypothetical protein